MQEYFQQFTRQQSNARILNNRHFINPISQLNLTEADLQEGLPKNKPEQTQIKTLS